MLLSSGAEPGQYLVTLGKDGWRVGCGAADIGVFNSRGAATEHACVLALRKARAGAIAIVVVQDEVREFHCFTPDEPALRAANDRFPGVTRRSI